MSDRNVQRLLTTLLVVLVIGAIFFREWNLSPWLLSALSVAAIAISFAGVQWRARGKTEAEHLNRNVRLPNDVTEPRPATIKATRETNFINGSSILDTLYQSPAKIAPVYREGDHFVCDAEVGDDYSISIGTIRVEVCDGEAKITVQQAQPEPAKRPALEKKGLAKFIH